MTIAEILAGQANDPRDAAHQFTDLHPFSGWRMRMVDDLGLRFFKALAASGDDIRLKNDLENGTYEGFDKDAVLILWVCSHTWEEIRWACDRFQRGNVLASIENWADERGIYLTGNGWDETDKAMRILCEVWNTLNADPDDDPKKKAEAD